MNIPLILFLLLAIAFCLYSLYFAWLKPKKFITQYANLGKKSEQGKGIVKIVNSVLYRKWKKEGYVMFYLWWVRIIGLLILISAVFLLLHEVF